MSSTRTAMLLLALVLSGRGAVQGLQEARQSGANFVNALKDGKFEAAYAMVHPKLKNEIGAANDLQKALEGNVVYEDGRQGAVTLELLKTGNNWKVTIFNFTW